MGIDKEIEKLASLLEEKGLKKESEELSDIRESFVFPSIKSDPKRLTRVQEQNRQRERRYRDQETPFAEEGEEVTELIPGKGERKIKYKKNLPVFEPEIGLRPKVLKKLASIKDTLEIRGYSKLASKLSFVTEYLREKQAFKEQHIIPYIEKVYEKSDSLSDLIDNLKSLSDFYKDMSNHIEDFREEHGKSNLEDKDIIQMVRKADRDTEKKILELMDILNNKKK